MNKQEWLRKPLSKSEKIGILKRQRKWLDKEIQKLYNYSTTKMQGVNMHQSIRDSLEELTIDELNVVKTELAEIIKAKKEEQKANAEVAFKNSVEVGDEVLFTFKGEERFGKVVKINDKSFTAELELEDGEVVKKPIKFHMFVGKVEEAAEDRAAV